MRQLTLSLAIILAGCSFEPAADRPTAADASSDRPDAAASSDVGVDLAVAPDAGDTNMSPADVGPLVDVAMPTDSGSDAAVSSDGGTPDAGPQLQPFFARAEVVNDRLTVVTNLRGTMASCPSTTDVPCDDVDLDGLVDAWETLVLERFRPLLVFDEMESRFNDPNAVLAHVGRVTPDRRGLTVDVYLTILYDRDYGSCGTLSSHDGDSERVFMTVEEVADGVVMQRAYTAAHEGTITDHSMRFEGADLDRLELDQRVQGEARWVVYPSRNKHATYITRAVCAGISPIPCFTESCGPDGVDPAGFTVLADVYNAGEPTAPMLEDLAGIGFPDEQAWVDQSFCGGRGRGSFCSGGVLGKLTESPF